MVDHSVSSGYRQETARPAIPAKMLALASSAALAACSVVGIREAEEPAHDVIARIDQIEIRNYAPRIAAETVVAGDELDARNIGFRRLARYIFGDNESGTHIAMTAPVAQSSRKIAMTAPVGARPEAGGKWTIRFFMPAHETLASLPVPKDAVVRLVTVPAETIAVLRFTGSTDPEVVAAKQKELLNRLAGGNWQPDGTPVAWFYDPPWTLPFLRRNEVAVPVVQRH